MPEYRMPFIVGAPRSGTTLLRFMIDSHPSIAIPPETGFLAAKELEAGRTSPEALVQLVTGYPPNAPTWPDFGLDAEEFSEQLRSIHPFDVGEGIRTFYRLYARNQNKIRYGDKTPLYCKCIARIERVVPEAAFIHLIRDGRDVAMSLRKMWFAPGRDMRTLGVYWRQLVESAREAGMRSSAYREVRFEDLILDPRRQLESICDFVELDFDPGMLHYWQRTPERLREHRTRLGNGGEIVVTHHQRLIQQQLTMLAPQPGRISSWKGAMSPAERKEFQSCAGGLLEELGYEV
jgi:hypothetical protein